jgi:SAM-dependent methyltransferase
MLTEALFQEGLDYAEDNFRNENAAHLKIDKQLIRKSFDLTGKKILDFGCGMGGMTLWYASNWNCDVLGLDIDRHHIEIAKQIQEKFGVKNIRFEKRNILEHPIDEKFDYVFLNDVAEHIPYAILTAIFKHLRTVLKPDGKIFVTYPPWHSPYASHVYHVVGIPWCQYLPEKTLLRLIAKNNRPIVGEEESDLIEAYKGLNHLTHDRLMKVITEAGFNVVSRTNHAVLNKLPLLKKVNFSFFPLRFLVTKEFLLLEIKK